MPHRCMNCGEEYDDGADELLEGCDCGSTLFMYKKDAADLDEDELREEKESVLDELDDFIRASTERARSDVEFAFDLESIRVKEEGVYEIDLRKLVDEVPVIVEVVDGNYRLHLPSVFSKGKEKGVRPEALTVDDETDD